MCICKCECGKETKARLNFLKSGNVKSCGCLKFNNPLMVEDLTGKKFNRLTVIERDFKKDQETKDRLNRSGNVHWICKCDCGNIYKCDWVSIKKQQS